MNFRTTIVLIVLLAAAMVFVLFERFGGSANTRTAPSSDEGDLAGRRLLDVKADDITRLVIRSADAKSTIELTRAAGNWNLLQPVNGPADLSAADQLLNGFLDLRSRGQIDLQGTNASATGLDHPRYTIELATRDGKTVKLAVGNRSALGNDLYLRSGDADRGDLVAAGALAAKLDQPTAKLVTSVRSKQLLTTSASQITQLEIARRDQRIILNKVGTDWQMLEPGKMPADPIQVESLIEIFVGLRAEEFVDSPEQAAVQFERPTASIWFSTQPPATQPSTSPATRPAGTTVTIGQPVDVLKEQFYVKSSESPVAIKAPITPASLEKLTKTTPLDLRDRRVVDIDPATVSRIQFLSDSPAATQPTLRPASHDELVIGRKKDSSEFGPAAPATLPSTQPSTLPATTQASTPAAATEPPLPPTVWAMQSPAKGDADQSRVEALLNALHPLRVENYLDPKGPTTQPVKSWTITINTEAAGAAKSAAYELRLVDPGAGKALIGEYNGLRFEVDRDLLSKLEGDFANKPRPAQPPQGLPPGFALPGMPGMGGE